MSVMYYLFDSFMILFDHDFTIFGYSLSFFDIFILSMIVGIVGKILYSLFE